MHNISPNERGCVETQSDVVQPAGANEDDGSAIGGGKLKKCMLLHLNNKTTVLWYVMLYKQCRNAKILETAEEFYRAEIQGLLMIIGVAKGERERRTEGGGWCDAW